MLIDLLKKRYSVRNFSERMVPCEIIDYVLEAGRLSPSGGNEQPWRFGVITESELIKEIAGAAYKQKWIESASFLIVLCTCVVGKDRDGRGVQRARYPRQAQLIQDMEDELYSKLHLEEHQTKIPGTHMVLAALEHGVGSAWVSYFDVDKVTEMLHLPEACYASEILAFGYPAEEKKPRPKKSIDEIVFYNIYK